MLSFLKLKYSGFVQLSLCLLAISVNFGVALVSVATLLVLISLGLTFLLNQGIDSTNAKLSTQVVFGLPFLNELFWLICLSISWFLLSFAWTFADKWAFLKQMVNFSRILLIPVVFFVIGINRFHFVILRALVIGHLFVILTSYLIWLGVPVFWYSYSDALRTFTPYTSSLEQPIISAVVFAIVWFCRREFDAFWGAYTTVICELVIAVNICFLMIGRSGIFAFVLLLSFILWLKLKKSLRYVALLFPVLISLVLYMSSPRVESRFDSMVSQVVDYQKGNIDTSQAIRLDFWRRSVQALEIRPVLGYGAGGWSTGYKEALNGDVGVPGADNPHQQFLLWGVEGGGVALVLLISIYYSVFKISLTRINEYSNLLRSVVLILFFVSFMNCPLHGAVLSEFFCLVVATLLSKLNELDLEKGCGC